MNRVVGVCFVGLSKYSKKVKSFRQVGREGTVFQAKGTARAKALRQDRCGTCEEQQGPL